MTDLGAAAPEATPMVARRAMAAFPGYADRIAHAAGLNGAPGGTRTAMAGSVPSIPRARPLPLASAGRRDKDRLARTTRTAAWAIAAIARNPGAIERVMSQAIAADPGGRAALVNAAQGAYPGYAARIANAAATARAPMAAAPAPRAIPQQPAMPRMATSTAVARPAPVSPAAPLAATTVRPIIAERGAVRSAPVPMGGSEKPEKLPRIDGSDEDDLEIDDPLEPMNRIIFALNETIDLVLLRPIAIGYNWIMPNPAIEAVRRFVLNLDAPVIMINDLLQGDVTDAGVTLGRFGINSTIGVLGLFDPAQRIGLERHHADFGQTLHSYEVGAGPYLVLPLIGPVSSRGGAGKVVDIFFQPLSYLLSGTESLALAAGRAVVRREELLDPLDELRENSIDYYTGLKAAFWQARQVELAKGTQAGLGDGGADKLFDAAN
jgi:phospholipid-binding lipoprotein MlaA